MIRLATPQDAPQLYHLNEQFNGPSDSTVEAIANALAGNSQEIVAVAQEDGPAVSAEAVPAGNQDTAPVAGERPLSLPVPIEAGDSERAASLPFQCSRQNCKTA